MSSRVLAGVLGLLAALPIAAVVQGAGLYPEAVNWSPRGTNVPTEAPIQITWSEQMNAGSVEAAFSVALGNQTWNATAFQWTHSTVPPWTSRATPRSPFPGLASITVLVLPTARDSRGYALDQDQDGVGGEPTDRLEWTFTSESGVPPRVVNTTPSDRATNVLVTTGVALHFDEAMNVPSVDLAFHVSPTMPYTSSGGANDTTVWFAFGLYLAYGTTYSVRLAGATAKDVNGHPLDGNGDGMGGDDYLFSFTTEPDRDAPRVLDATPATGGNVSVTADVAVRFSEGMDRASVEAALAYTDGATTWNRTAGAFLWSGRTFQEDFVTFNPDANFPFASVITVTLNASLARDPAGFGLDGNGDNASQGSPVDDVTWSFTTEAADSTPPTVRGIAPAGGAIGVFETTTLLIAFSEAMDRASVEAAFSLRDLIRTWTKDDGTFTWGRGDDAVEYTPATTLSFDTSYLVGLAGSAKDVNGNAMGGPFLSSFRTRPQPDVTPPHVLNTIPADGETGVARDPVLSISFDDAMDGPSTESAISLANASGPEQYLVSIGDFRWDGANHTVSFQSSASLDWSRTYRVAVGPGARDDAGLALETTFSFSFRTAPWSARVIGRVADEGITVAGAIVTLAGQTTQTDDNGSFAFPSVPNGTYDLTVAKAGYAMTKVSVTVSQRDAAADGTTINVGTVELRRVEGPSPALVAASLGAAAVAVLLVGLVLRRLRPPPPEMEEPEDYEDAPDDEEFPEADEEPF